MSLYMMDNETAKKLKSKVDLVCSLYRLSTEDQEDLSQDIMLKLMEVDFCEVDNIDDYVFIVARNEALNYLRKEDRDEKLIERLKEKQIIEEQINDNGDHIENLRIAFEEELENLPPQQKKIMEMVYDGVSQKQIAIELGISDGHLYKQLHRARKKIQNKIL